MSRSLLTISLTQDQRQYSRGSLCGFCYVTGVLLRPTELDLEDPWILIRLEIERGPTTLRSGTQAYKLV